MITKTFVADGSAQALLTQELAEANKAYRNSGITLMSDLEYDKKLEELAALEEKNGFKYDISPTGKVGAEAVSELKKVTHEYPALSLDKVKYKDREDLVKWLKSGKDSAVISWKNDGLTVCATYEDGRLVQAATRGDGEVGNDITHNAMFFKGLPKEITYKGHLVVRGEAVMKTAEFERVNALSGGIYENPRNLASATIQMLDANESRKREINFIAFELVCPEPELNRVERNDKSPFGADAFYLQYMQDRLDFMEYLGFQVVDRECIDSFNILEKIEQWKDALKGLDYPTDGLVISYNDMVFGMSLGNTGHHFRHSMALKWSDETLETTIRDIEWSVGKTGIITPVAIFDEVRLGLGSNVTRASLHNLSVMKNLSDHSGAGCQSTLIIGAKAEVYLANMIIPQIASVTKDEDTQAAITPQKCPVCGAPTRIEISNENGLYGTFVEVATLHCDNTFCPARQIGCLMNTFSKDGLFIRGLGESQIIDLMEEGLVNADPLSFYELADEDRENDIASLLKRDGWGMKKWENLVSAINASRETTLQKFLYSLNVPLLGNDLSKKLSKHFGGDIKNFIRFIEDVSEYVSSKRDEFVNAHPDEEKINELYRLSPSYKELSSIDGIGDEKALNVVSWCDNVSATLESWEDFRALVQALKFPEPQNTPSDNSLEGLTFVITGSVHDYKNRDEFKASVEARGGKVAGSVSTKTSFLVNNDITSTSGKNAKAKELNIPIISEDEFINRFGK